MPSTENSAALNEKKEVDLLQPWNDLDPYSAVEQSITFTAVSTSDLPSWHHTTCVHRGEGRSPTMDRQWLTGLIPNAVTPLTIQDGSLTATFPHSR